MINRIVIATILSMILLSGCKVREHKSAPVKNMEKYNYEQAWKKVEELEQKGLAKTMFKKVLEIYEQAAQSANGEQLIKSLVYQGKYFIAVEEEGLLKTIGNFESNLENISQPEQSILQSMLAELYDTYLTQYLWKIGNRIPTADKPDADIRNWTPQQFVDMSTKLYLASISYPELENIPVNKFRELVPPKKNATGFRNNLLDILGHRAIKYFSVGKSYLSESPDRYILNDPALFSSTEAFNRLDFELQQDSRELTVLKLFQKLLQSKIQSGNQHAVLDLEIHRLQYIRRHFIGTDADALYEKALLTFRKDYKEMEGVAEVNFYLAEFYYNQGIQNTYQDSGDPGFFLKAHDICSQTIQQYPNSLGADRCRSLLYRIENKKLNVRTEIVNMPGENLIARIEYKNLKGIYFKVVVLDQEKYGQLNNLKQGEISGFLKPLKTLQEDYIDLPGTDDFKEHATEIALSPLNLGCFALVVSDNNDFDPEEGVLQVAPFFVSTLSYWHTSIGDEQLIYVVDRKTGMPLEHVKVKIFQWNYETRTPYRKLLKTLTTNRNGVVNFDNLDSRGYNYTIELQNDKETLYFENSIYAGSRGYGNVSSAREKVLYFTDRSIYRPGQTVYFKGLLVRDNNQTGPEIIPFRNDIEVVLKDVNQQTINSTKLSTNEFGSFSGSFILPEKGLTGQFNISSNLTGDRSYIQVESYKRPQFFVELKPYESTYKLGDNILIDGMAQSYGGVNISNAQVSYRVMRKSYFPYWRYSWRPLPFDAQELEITNGVTQTDASSNFEIPVELLADDHVPDKFKPHFHYEVTADVVDQTGETHSAQLTLRAGWTDLDVRLNLPEESHRDSSIIAEVISNNWNGEPQDLKGRLKVYQLKTPSQLFRVRYWMSPDQWIYDKKTFRELFPSYGYKGEENIINWEEQSIIEESSVNTGTKTKYDLDLPEGSYKVVFEYLNSKGVKEQIETFTSVYTNSMLPAQVTHKFIAKGGQPGEKANLSIQLAKKGTAVFFELFEKNERVRAEWKSPSPKDIVSIDIQEKHRGNFFARITYVQDNRFYTETRTLVVPWTNKELEFEYLSYRDKLKPGARESWTIMVKGKQKDQVLAEMLATMYDASLDDIHAHRWRANLFGSNYLMSRVHYFGFGQNRSRSYVERNWNKYYYSGKDKTYNTINWFGLENIPGYQVFKEGVGVVESAPPVTLERMYTDRVASGVSPSEADMEDITSRSIEEAYQEETGDGTEVSVSETEKKPLPQTVRENLNETVFFYPHLKTDESGNVLIEFTMNEALTSWKFMGFAHTKDLMTGITTSQIKTQKELMIRPNSPRFIRLEDKFKFSASISNLSEDSLSGTARIEFFDAITLENVTAQILDEAAEKPFEVLPKGNIGIGWDISIPQDCSDLLQYKVFAKSGSFTDGETGYLPVLSNRVLVTETMPMWIGGKQSKNFQFNALEKMADEGLKSHNFSIESTSNPVWYAIQAMPYISQYDQHNSIQLVNALYANMLAKHIVQNNPSIEKVFRKWQEEASYQPGTLLSKLQRNEELKNILLKETPWLLEGLDESAKKKNIALLFELNNVQQEKTQILSLLKGLQKYDGGFSWYNGGRSSEYLTVYVLNVLGRLETVGINVLEDSGFRDLIQQAVFYVDSKIAERYESLLELAETGSIDLDEDHLGSLDIYYLHTRAVFSSINSSPQAREARIYYTNQAEKYYLNKSNYLQGMIALMLNSAGNSSVALEILKSLEERSIFHEELGRYWKDRNGYHWTEFPIEKQALLIEAFHKISKDPRIVNEMQVWLLKHKQTNRWSTARASVAAINALLLNNQRILTEAQTLSVKIDGTELKPELDDENYETGTGYFKKSWKGSEISESMKHIQMQNPNDHIAWGAAYWQYFQDIDKVTNFEETPLTIRKELYLVINDKKGEKLIKIADEEIVAPGSKIIVRLRIEADRSMDFVRLDDQRGAAMEPLNQVSGYRYTGGLFYYEAPGDTGTSFYIDHLPQGVFVLEYPLRAVHSGNYTVGLATLQSMYAPEFSSHSEGGRFTVN
jgi:5-hydroxyisourate hydrolase-like protein (transthyretin family)